MTTRDLQRARMVRSTLAVCDEHRPIWADLPAFALAVEELRVKLAELDSQIAAANASSSNLTHEKKEKRLTMVRRTLMVLNTLEVYADVHKDMDLKQAVKTERGYLWNAPGEGATTHCRKLLAIARTKQTDLDAYQLTTERLDELEEAITAHDAMITLPRMTVHERKERNAMIHALVPELSKILIHRMDKLMYLLRERSAEFAQAYAAARASGAEALTPAPDKSGL
ncbi:MAG: hypothetical protein IPG69_16695 [Flavobacteriales bacterium]|nr:hypothetical protein [Flavobacteriales bacterium]